MEHPARSLAGTIAALGIAALVGIAAGGQVGVFIVGGVTLLAAVYWLLTWDTLTKHLPRCVRRLPLVYDHEATADASPDLAAQIDALLGKGMVLLNDLSQPLRAGEGGRIDVGVDDETADRIWDLYDGAFALLDRERRAYLPLLADAINAAVAKRVPARITMQIPSKTRSNEDEIRAFYEANRAYPKAIVEGTLDGLAKVGRSLGHDAPRPQRTGIETEGGSLRGRHLRIRGQDRGIAAKNTKTDLEDTDIE